MNGVSVLRSLLLVYILLSHSFCFADENKLSGALMQAWENIATPNENHQVLDFLVGRWNYKATSWMTPTAAPQAFKGVTDHRWILGNRVLLQEHIGVACTAPH